MKTLITATALLAGLVMTAGTASAASPAYCDGYARNYANQYANPAGGLLGGAIIGGAAGGLIAGATGGNVGTGIGIGAVGGGLVGGVGQGNRWNILYQQAYAQCVNSGPTYVAPGPSGDPWQACAAKYKSFQWSGPYAGMFKGYDGLWHPCPYL
jgi:hypothetical protein